MSGTRVRYPLWVRGDLDGFFGLMVDNLVQVLLIIDLCKYVAGLPDALIFERILPGVAISLIIGNVFYGLQARRVARRDGNLECTALPYGINTPSVVAFVLFVMGPVYARTQDPNLAWQAGLIACFVSGIIEFLGAFVAEKLRRVTPRAALLGVLAAVGIAFIAAEFAFRIYTFPLVGVLPMAILLLAYFARFRFPFRLPGGFVAIVVGSVIAWGMSLTGQAHFGAVEMSTAQLAGSLDQIRLIVPVFAGAEMWQVLTENSDLWVAYLTVSIPMGLLNVIGSLQNIESAEAGGDRFRTGPSLAVNGVGTIAASLFGSCFPTTIYIGHPGWKALGARSSYSILNGIFFTAFFLLGLGPFLRALIPIEAGAAIVMYIGLIITAQAFQATPKAHAPAVAIALFPALAAFVVVTLTNQLGVVGGTLVELVRSDAPVTLYLPGLITLTGANSAWILLTLILTAIGAALIDRRYGSAAIWSGAASVLTFVGGLHAYRLEGNVLREFFIWQAAPTAVEAAGSPEVIAYRALPIAIGYAAAAGVFAWVAISSARVPPSAPEPDAYVRNETIETE